MSISIPRGKSEYTDAHNGTSLISDLRRYPTKPDTVFSYQIDGRDNWRLHQRYYTPNALLIKYAGREADDILSGFRLEASRFLQRAMWYHEDSLRPLANALANTNYSALSVEFMEHEGYLVNLRYGEAYTVHIQILFGEDALIEDVGYYNVYTRDELVIFGESSLDRIVNDAMEYVQR